MSLLFLAEWPSGQSLFFFFMEAHLRLKTGDIFVRDKWGETRVKYQPLDTTAYYLSINGPCEKEQTTAPEEQTASHRLQYDSMANGLSE